MDANDPAAAPAATGAAEGTTPRTFRFPNAEWERVEACAEARGLSAAEFVRFAVRAAVEAGPATPGAADRLAPLIERTFRYSYMIATKMRDDMAAEGRDEEMEALVRTARALQDELTGDAGDSRRRGGDDHRVPFQGSKREPTALLQSRVFQESWPGTRPLSSEMMRFSKYSRRSSGSILTYEMAIFLPLDTSRLTSPILEAGPVLTTKCSFIRLLNTLRALVPTYLGVQAPFPPPEKIAYRFPLLTMSVSHSAQYEPTRPDVWTVLDELPHRVEGLLKRHESSRELGFEAFERELHALFTHAECVATREALERHDVDLPHVFLDEEKHHRAYRGEKTYLCAVGPVTAMRTLYRARAGERAVAAMERRVGIVEGDWTPLAARQGAMLTAHVVPREAEEMLAAMGNMMPSRSSLDRLPKALSARWEAQRVQFEASVREATLEVPDTACTVAVSLDGVMAPMKGEGGGYREASCASVSLYDAEGERLSTLRMARMPEEKKATLKTMVAAEVNAVLGQRPELKLVKIADGAKDNWTFLGKVLPEGVELIDFFHAAEHIKDGFDAAYGADDPKATAQFEKYRHVLRHDSAGVGKVIRALRHLRSKHPHNERVAQALGYFRNNQHRMGYAAAKDQDLPIGSGVVETRDS